MERRRPPVSARNARESIPGYVVCQQNRGTESWLANHALNPGTKLRTYLTGFFALSYKEVCMPPPNSSWPVQQNHLAEGDSNLNQVAV